MKTSEILKGAKALIERGWTRDFSAPEDAEVMLLGRRIGFGALVDAASKTWADELARKGLPNGGQHVGGPCEVTVSRLRSQHEAALAAVRAAMKDG